MQFSAKSAVTSPFKTDYDTPATAVPIALSTPVAAPYSAASDRPSRSPKFHWICRALQLMPFHVLNFGLGTIGFCAELVAIAVAVALLPLSCFGISASSSVLPHLTGTLATVDITLADRYAPIITARCRGTENDSHLAIAPVLSTISVRSMKVVLYFVTLKMVIGLASLGAVALPFCPALLQFITSSTAAKDDSFDWHWGYAIACVSCFFGGLVMLRWVAVVSRSTTCRVCCLSTKAADECTPV